MATQPGDHDQPAPKENAHTGPIPTPAEFTPDELQQLEEAEEELLPKQANRRRPTMYQPAPEFSDPGIELGLPTPSPNAGEPSGVSFIQWSSLVEETKPSTEDDKSLSIDSESDSDIRLQEEAQAAASSHPVIEDPAFPVLEIDAPAKPIPSKPDRVSDEETVDLGVLEGEVVEEELVSEVTEADLEVVDLEAAGVDSGVIDVGADEVIDDAEVLPEDEEVVDLGADEVVEVPDSAVMELGDDAALMDGSSIIDLKMEQVGEESVDLGAGNGGKGGSSSRDLIAEAVESGVDIVEVVDEVIDVPLEEVNETEPEEIDPLMQTTALETTKASEEDHGDYQEIGTALEEVDEGEEVVDVPLEEVDAEEVDLGGLPDTSTEWNPSGIDAPEEVDLEGLHGVDVSPSVSRQEKKTGRGKLNKAVDVLPGDAEEIDLGSSMGGSSMGHLEEGGEDADLDKKGLDKTGESDESLEKEAAEGDDLAPVDIDDEEAAPAKKKGKAGKAGTAVVEGEEDEAKADKKAAKAKSRTPAWIGGTVLGAVLGAGTFGALSFFNIIPALNPPATAPKQMPITQNPPPVVPAGPTLTAADHLKHGDLDKAQKAGIETVANNEPDKLALRGQFRLENYLAAKGKAGEPIKANDPKLTEALDDLKKAESTAEGLFHLARAQEIAGLTAQAKATYEIGEKKFKNDPRFRYGLLRLEAVHAEPAAGAGDGKEKASGRLPLSEEQAMAVILLTLLQAPKGPADTNPKPAAEEEAGASFWEAVKLARAQNYAEAIKKLDQAQKIHAQRRFSQLHKQQNPGSDPNEEIFLSSVKELKQYWTLQEQLRSGGYLNLTDRRDPAVAVDGLVKELVASRALDVDLAKKLIDAKIIAKADELGKGVDTLLADRTADRDKVAELDKNLKTALKQADDAAVEAKNQLAALKKDLDTNMKTAADQLAKARQETGEREDLLKKLQTELVDAKYVDAKADRAGLVTGLKEALKVASMKDPGGAARDLQKQVAAAKMELAEQSKRLEAENQKTVAKLTEERVREVTGLKKALAIRRPPADLLPLWLPRLQESANLEQAQQALADAKAATADPESAPVTRAQASVIEGLALRNMDQFAMAQKPLTDALAILPKEDKVWRGAAEAGLADVTDPAKFYAGRADKLRDMGNFAAAKQLMDRGVKALPENAGLLSERTLLLVEMARFTTPETGTLTPANPLLVQARKDAAQAITLSKDNKALLGRAYFAAGRAFEESGNLADALESYRAAVREWPTFDGQGSRYRAALARVLVQPRIGRPAAPKEKEPEELKMTLQPRLQDLLRLAANPKTENEARQLLLVLMTTSLQLPGQPMPADRSEAIRLANEIIAQHQKMPGSVPFDVLAEAYSIKGLWTRALVVYVDGLKPYVRNDYYQGLLTIVRNHPQLRRPETLNPPNPFEAENRYAQGLTFYYSCNFADAERQFRLATEYDNQDARYFYFLGLSRLMLGKPEAAEDFEQGAKLEKQNRPSSAVISTALERIQGPTRRLLNEARKNVP